MKEEGGKLIDDRPASERLDAVLKIFAEDWYSVQGFNLEGITVQSLRKKLEDQSLPTFKKKDAFNDTSHVYLQSIVDKLVKSEYLKPLPDDRYAITFDGDIFN